MQKFDQCRNVDWQNANYKYAGGYVKRKIDELKIKWYSSRCYLKRDLNEEVKNANPLYLTSLFEIKKDELFAKILITSLSRIKPEQHNIRNSDDPNCYLIDDDVFALADIKPNTEITINFKIF